MGVMRRVACTFDDRDTTVRELRIEGDRGIAKHRQAVAAQDLQDRLADGTKSLDRGGRIRFRPEFPEDRSGRIDSGRPDRVVAIGGEVGGGHPDDLGQEHGQGTSEVAGRDPALEPVLDPERVVGRARRRRRSFVGDDPPHAFGQQRCPERTPPSVGVTEDVDPLSGSGNGVGDGRDILELTLDRIIRAIARCPPPAPIDGVDGERRGQDRPDDPEGRVIGRRTMDEDERRAGPTGEDRDRRPVRRDDLAARLGGAGQRGISAAAASSRIQVAPARRAN